MTAPTRLHCSPPTAPEVCLGGHGPPLLSAEAIGRNDGTVQKLITDPSLYNNLNDSAEMVTKILPRLDRTMRDMETFADKLARHPELLGLRGAVFPSSGLKESPSRPYHIYP